MIISTTDETCIILYYNIQINIRYLEVLIIADLRWSDHVTTIYAKARKQLGFIYRKFYGHASRNTLKTLYTTFVRPRLEYAVPVWDPHLKDILALESVQRLATKICTKAWHGVPYEDRLILTN